MLVEPRRTAQIFALHGGYYESDFAAGLNGRLMNREKWKLYCI